MAPHRLALSLAALLATAALAVAGCGGSSHHSVKATAAPKSAPTNGIPQNNGGDQDADNNGGPSDGDGNI